MVVPMGVQSLFHVLKVRLDNSYELLFKLTQRTFVLKLNGYPDS